LKRREKTRAKSLEGNLRTEKYVPTSIEKKVEGWSSKRRRVGGEGNRRREPSRSHRVYANEEFTTMFSRETALVV